MTTNRVAQNAGQTLAGVAIVLVVAALLFVLVGVVSQAIGMLIFGGIVFGIAVVVGIVGMAINR